MALRSFLMTAEQGLIIWSSEVPPAHLKKKGQHFRLNMRRVMCPSESPLVFVPK